MNINNLENLPCNVDYLSNGLCTVSFTLPSENINGFVAMLSGLASLFRGLGWKSKTNIDHIHERIELKTSVAENIKKDYESAICMIFEAHTKCNINGKLALSLTAEEVKKQYEFSSYDMVKNILSKNKYLKKTGFYKIPRTMK